MAVSHKNLPDSELHVPKGYGNATANQVLTKGADPLDPEWKFLDASNLADNSVGTGELQANSVTTVKIPNNAVTKAKIANFDAEVAAVIAPSVAGGNYNLYTYGSLISNGSTSAANGFFEVIALAQGTIRIQWRCYSSNSGRGVTTQLLKNGSAIYSNSTDTNTLYTQDVSVSYGDVFRVTFRDDGGLSNIAYFTDFAVQATQPIARAEFLQLAGTVS